ncbi:hypothetical protein ACFQ1M_11065 [Sungkyunkwania multivorans]|uniref:Uncharacterized protein n=1 Tax=Sungkyunkwania multivorans TaxID=1173618 RepID=A0ABW3CY69_9FLAO
MADPKDDIALFQLLLQEVAAVFLKNNSASAANMTDWKGQDIVQFQEDLRAKVQGSISEKWFYSYVKNTPEKLPRIDILNLLSTYADYQSWNHFKEQHRQVDSSEKKVNKKILIPIVLASLIIVAIAYSMIPTTHHFHFCFVDADKKEAIRDITIDIIILNEGESPTHAKTDSLGCFDWATKKDHIRLVAQSPYHKNDTIYRTLASGKNQVYLKTDDYALMLHYYTNGKVKDWQKRREVLDKLIADDALIFELLPQQLGVTIYEKQEFIDKLTTPTQSLQKLQIVETRYSDGKIAKLKFKITP